MWICFSPSLSLLVSVSILSPSRFSFEFLLFCYFICSYVRVFAFFVCVCSFLLVFVCLFVSISYICLLAKFIRFSFRFLFSMFSAFPLDSPHWFLSCYFFFATLQRTHTLALSPSLSSKFIHNKVYRSHCFSLFSLLLNLGTFPSVRKVDSHAHTHSLFSRVFVLLSHSHTRTIPTQRGDCLVVPLLFAIVSGCLFFFFSFVQINLPKRTFFRLTLLIFLRQLLFAFFALFEAIFYTFHSRLSFSLSAAFWSGCWSRLFFFLGDFGEKLFEIFFMFMKVMFSCDPIGQKRGCVEIFFVMFTIFYFHDED